MGIQTTTSDLIPTGLCHYSLAKTREQRADHQYRATKSRTFTHELITFKIGKVYAVGLKLIIISGDSLHLHFDVLQQLNEIVHIQDVRYVADNDRVTAQQGGTDNLQRLVLSTLWSNGTTQRMTAFDDK